jgi:hypothetical protein
MSTLSNPSDLSKANHEGTINAGDVNVTICNLQVEHFPVND